MIRVISILLLLLSFVEVKAQFSEEEQAYIDSLDGVTRTATHDTTRCNAYAALSEILYLSSVDTLVALSNTIIEIAEKNLARKNLSNAENIAFQSLMAGAINNLGYSSGEKGRMQESMDYYKQCQMIQEKIGDKKGLAATYNNIGYAYDTRGELTTALDYYQKSLTLREEVNDQIGIGICLSNIGYIYDEMHNIKKALEFYHRALALQKRIDDKVGIALSFDNIGSIYHEVDKDNYKARMYLDSSISIQRETGDLVGVGRTMNHIAQIFEAESKTDSALYYYQRALKLYEELPYMQGVGNTLVFIGQIELKRGQIKKAESTGRRALQLGRDLGMVEIIQDASLLLSHVYAKQKNYERALKLYQQFIEMRDNITNRETNQEILEAQIEYEYDKARLKDSVSYAKEKEMQDILIAKKQAESERKDLLLEKENTRKYVLYGGLAILAVILALIFFRLRVTMRQKTKIEQQKEEIDIQRKAAEKQRTKIKEQHDILEITHQELSDSIRYAKRLQQAILPTPEELSNGLGEEGFVFFRPKEQVSGDFFWMQKVVLPGKTKTLFAVADCTGHGVPGAMVSVVCSNALNRSVKEFAHTQPSAILDQTRAEITETFSHSSESIYDGMDVALCAMNYGKKGKSISYSGANNPLWIVRKREFIAKSEQVVFNYREVQDLSLLEFKPDKQPVATYFEMKPFSQQEISLYPGDTIYVFSDGLADQFGGPKGKKFKYRRFKELLLSIYHQNMDQQKEMIRKALEEWQGDFEQVDDICIIGVRV